MNFGYSCSDLVEVYEVENTLHGLIGSSDCPLLSLWFLRKNGSK